MDWKKILSITFLLIVFNLTIGAVKWNERQKKVVYFTNTGSGAMSTALAPAKAFRLHEIRVHLSSASATSENFTITMDAGAGAAYDTVLFSKDLNTLSDYVYTFESNRFFTGDDELDIAWANSDSRTFGLEVVYEVYK